MGVLCGCRSNAVRTRVQPDNGPSCRIRGTSNPTDWYPDTEREGNQHVRCRGQADKRTPPTVRVQSLRGKGGRENICSEIRCMLPAILNGQRLDSKLQDATVRNLRGRGQLQDGAERRAATFLQA